MRPTPLRRRSWTALALAAALAAALGGCGGSGDDRNPLAIDAVKVVGDSLSDSGTFASVPGGPRIASVQGSANEPYVLWVERVALAYQLDPLCPVYQYTGTGFAANAKAGCTNYAVAGARINNPASAGGADSPFSVPRQLADAAAKGWRAQDVLLADGGGNDAADLITAYLGASADHGAAYAALLGTLLPADTLATVLAAEQGAETAGGLYMQALADSLANALQTQALDQGAAQVLVANMPGITDTPRFQAVLAQIAAAAGADAAAQAQALFQGWVGAFNQRLAQRFAGNPKVRVFDLATRFADEVAHPAQYGLTNVTLPVCGAEWVTAVPQRSFAECTASALSATTPPTGGPTGAGWWQQYLFADGFHPTPYGHQLFGQQVLEVLGEAGWR